MPRQTKKGTPNRLTPMSPPMPNSPGSGRGSRGSSSSRNASPSRSGTRIGASSQTARVCRPLFPGQEYDKILRLLRPGELFVDKMFPANVKSLWACGNVVDAGRGIEWKRPGEITSKPQLFVEGIQIDDVTQGIIGDCWFVAACSVLTHHKVLLERIIPEASKQEKQLMDPKSYHGIFKFNFWILGEWREVVVDDFLPAKSGKLVFAHSKERNEFWCALLEKAFAKMFGCYESLEGGHVAEAFTYITGGIPESISIKEMVSNSDTRKTFFESIRMFYDNNALMSASVAVENVRAEKKFKNGLVGNHAYGVTCVCTVNVRSIFNKDIKMVRLRNPWGGQEWNGPWSDDSNEWKAVPESEKKRIGLVKEDDGEFWMCWEDFCDNFTKMSVCHLFNTTWFCPKMEVNAGEFLGRWTHNPRDPLNNRSGGCTNNADTWAQNPQYRFDVLEDGARLWCSLTQESCRAQGKEHIPIGFSIEKVEANREYRMHRTQKEVGYCTYSNQESVFLRMEDMTKGRYVAVPTTWTPGLESIFLLRLYSTKCGFFQELTLDAPLNPNPPLLAVTRVSAFTSKGLPSSHYFVAKCEGQSEKSPQFQVPASADAQGYDWTVMFYRRHPAEGAVVEVHSSRGILGTVNLAPSSLDKLFRMTRTLDGARDDCKGAMVTFDFGTFGNLMHY